MNKEITAERYNEALEILPPALWLSQSFSNGRAGRSSSLQDHQQDTSYLLSLLLRVREILRERSYDSAGV
jgi:hypothetical protein